MAEKAIAEALTALDTFEESRNEPLNELATYIIKRNK